MTIPKDAVFMVVGLGLMGGSYAMGLTKQGHRVLAIDSDTDALVWAQQNALIEQGAAADSDEAHSLLALADYVVLALYPGGILPWLRQNKAHLKSGAMLTDIAGVKSCFVDEAQALLAPQHEFIPCHPMAGRELRGVQNASDKIFAGANFLITPTERNSPAGIEFAQTLAKTLGFGQITQLGVAQHDDMIAHVSQLTHAIAIALMNANDDPLLPQVTGDSFRDLTRIADINADLWSELFLANAPSLVAEMDAFLYSLGQIREQIARQDKDGLVSLMQRGAARRRIFGQAARGAGKAKPAAAADAQLENRGK